MFEIFRYARGVDSVEVTWHGDSVVGLAVERSPLQFHLSDFTHISNHRAVNLILVMGDKCSHSSSGR